MTHLQHPTIAQQVADDFHAQRHPDGSNRTVSVITIAEARGGERSVLYKWGRKLITYTFDDDSSITSTGRGRAHKLEVHLP